MRANGLLEGRRVLVVEDEAVTALMIEDALEDAGCFVVGPVASVHDALALVESEAIDCAILDIELIDGQCGPVAEAWQGAGCALFLRPERARHDRAAIRASADSDQGVRPGRASGHGRGHLRPGAADRSAAA